jgi:hypothetical protein
MELLIRSIGSMDKLASADRLVALEKYVGNGTGHLGNSPLAYGQLVVSEWLRLTLPVLGS